MKRRRWEPQRVSARIALTALVLTLLAFRAEADGTVDNEEAGDLNGDTIPMGDSYGGPVYLVPIEPEPVDASYYPYLPTPRSIELRTAENYASYDLREFDEYQSYISRLSYAAKLIVRPDASTVAENASVSFFCRVDGNPLPNVHWKINGKSVTEGRFKLRSHSSGMSFLRIDRVSASDNNSLVSCSADNGVGNPVHAEATLTVLKKDELPLGFPKSYFDPNAKSAEYGKTAQLDCKVEGDPRPKILWLRDGMPIDTRAEERYSISTLAKPGALMIQRAMDSDQGRYECVARNALGVAHSNGSMVYIKVRRVPPYFPDPPRKAYKVAAGGSINITCIAHGYPVPRVLWRKSEEESSPDFSQAPIAINVLTLSNVETTENFTCIAVSKFGHIEATSMVVVKPIPAAPVNLRITSGPTADVVSLAWDPVALSSEEPLTKNVVKYRQKSNGATPRSTPPSTATADEMQYMDSTRWREHVVGAADTTAAVGGLEPFTLYEFVVQSYNEIGGGVISHPREAQTGEAPPASPPVKVQSRALQSAALHVQWSAPVLPNGFITGYTIFYTDGDGTAPIENWKKLEIKSDERMGVVRELLTDKRYFIAVSARNSKGESPPSKSIPVKTTYGLPGQPIGLASSPLDATRVQLAWERPVISLPITGYVIRHNSTDGDKEFTLTNTQAEKHIVRDLKPLTTYAFRVAAQSNRGIGEFSDEVIVSTLNGTIVSAPLRLSVSALSPSSLALSWSPPPLDATVTLLGYVIRYRSIGDVTKEASRESDESEESPKKMSRKAKKKLREEMKWSEIIVAGNEAVLNGLIPATTYEVTVAGEALATGVGVESDAVQARTQEHAMPPPTLADNGEETHS